MLSGVFDRAVLRSAGIVHELLWRSKRTRPPRRRVEVDADALVSMICVSNRPDQLDHVVETWRSQTGCRVELVLVTNADGYAPIARERLAGVDMATVIETDPSWSLGRALRLGITAARGTVLAKIDDDDEYAPRYLVDSVATMRTQGAGVVGKKTYFVHLGGSDRTLLMYPGNEDRRVGRVAGGSIVTHRDVTSVVRFPNRTLGEDVGFVRAAERAGFAVFSGPARGYLQVRDVGLDHTWTIDEGRLAAAGRVVGSGRSEDLWA